MYIYRALVTVVQITVYLFPSEACEHDYTANSHEVKVKYFMQN